MVTSLDLLDIHTIYYEPDIVTYARGREILDKYPDTERIEVPSHWKIPGLHGNEGSVDDWIGIKRSVLVLGTKKSVTLERNERSSNFIAPSHANGCAMACSYCYVPRRKGFANPITTFVNIEQVMRAIERHAVKQGEKRTPDLADPNYWVYEIGNNNDCSVDAAVCDNVRDLVGLFRRLPNAKATFATKFVNRNLLDYDPQGKVRIRFSLVPSHIARLIDVRTSKVEDRIAAINDFVDAGYDVNVNFAPIVTYEGWLDDYDRLFEQVDDSLSPAAKAQMQTEIIFLTHNDRMHAINEQWHPKAEELLWRPEIQETKYSESGGRNVRYKHTLKSGWVSSMVDHLKLRMPYCAVRYAF